MTPLNPTDRLTVELEAQQWNQVLTLIATGRFCDVANLMQIVQSQLQNPRDERQRNVFPMEAGE